MLKNRLFFDKQDYELLTFINKVLIMQKDAKVSEDMLNVSLHPHGIKTLAMSREMRVANAMIRLLSSSQNSDSGYRLQALRTLFDEVLNSAKTRFRRNTARVLVEIMKALVRAQGDIQKQLYLASDFRNAAQGKPHTVRAFLKEYGLIEMPEDWSQLTFDHHVHDINTKGRKSPTHLVMDASIKGIRYITVIYYNFIDEKAAAELLRAAHIIGLHVRIGIEFSLPFGEKHVQFVWAPRNATNPERFLEFLAEAPMQHLMRLGREASAWRAGDVYRVLRLWNETHRQDLALHVGVDPEHLGEFQAENFKNFVGTGQASHVHLAEFIYAHIAPVLEQRRAELKEELQDKEVQCQEHLAEQLQKQKNFIEEVSIGYIYDNYVNRTINKNITALSIDKNDPQRPELLRLTPLSLLDWLTSIQTGGSITLKLDNLTTEDVLILLWQCQGLVTHLEIFNVRAWNTGRLEHLETISDLQQALNTGSAPRLKHLVRMMLQEREALQAEENTLCPMHVRRLEILREILCNIKSLKNLYDSPPLRSRMGSNATDRPTSHGHMGLVFPETLPSHGYKAVQNTKNALKIPFHLPIHYVVRYTPSILLWNKSRITRIIQAIPGCKRYGYTMEQEWRSQSSTAKYGEQSNISLLKTERPLDRHACTAKKLPPKQYLNSRINNILKVILGFIPASIAFHYTQTWWVLAWFGPIIWFSITGVRNVIQFVVAGTGFHRASLLRWNDHVSWSRLCDSLLYTGFSVPLLELGVRILLLQDTLHINTVTHPVLVYTVMSTVNGLYISWHNIIRGLPKEAVIGNLFRSVLAIPMALLFNTLTLEFLQTVMQVPNAVQLVATSSAIISKMASDTVAAIIEGYADMKLMVRMRRWDYETKIKDLFYSYVRLDLTFPEEDINTMLASPRLLLQRVAEKNKRLHAELIINALDLQYFWYYRPRAREVCKKLIRQMSPEERTVFASLQRVLLQEREVSQLFVDGLVGRHFSKALAFYLNNHRAYVKTMSQLCAMNYEEEDEDES